MKRVDAFAIACIFSIPLVDSLLGALLTTTLPGSSFSRVVPFIKYGLFGAATLLFLLYYTYNSSILRVLKIAPASLLAYIALVLPMTVILIALRPDHIALNRFYSYVCPPLVYMFGLLVANGSDRSQRIPRLCLIVRFSLTLYVLVNLFFLFTHLSGLSEMLWGEILEYGNYMENVKGISDNIGNLPGNFYYDKSGEAPIARFVGIFGDPLALSYSSMILFYWSGILRQTLSTRILRLCLICFVILSLTRGVILASLIVGLLNKLDLRNKFSLVLLGGTALKIIPGFFLTDISVLSVDSSTEGHLDSSIKLFSALGDRSFLLGSFFTDKGYIFESGLFNIIVTYGLLPGIVLLIFFNGRINSAPYESCCNRQISESFLFGLFTLISISPSFFAFSSSALAWFLAGFCKMAADR